MINTFWYYAKQTRKEDIYGFISMISSMYVLFMFLTLTAEVMK